MEESFLEGGGMMGVKEETRVTGTSKEGEGGGKGVTIVGENKKQQGKIELLSQWTLEG